MSRATAYRDAADGQRLGNLDYVTPATHRYVEAILADPAVRRATKAIIRGGLNTDCTDAARDTQLAADVLERVRTDVGTHS